MHTVSKNRKHTFFPMHAHCTNIIRHTVDVFVKVNSDRKKCCFQPEWMLNCACAGIDCTEHEIQAIYRKMIYYAV